MDIPPSADKHRFVRDSSLWLLYVRSVYVCMQIMSLLLTADVTFGHSQNYVTVATLPHTAVVFRMQPINLLIVFYR